MSENYSFERLKQDLIQLYDSGDFAGAYKLVERNEPSFPENSARITFWKMCLLSLDGQLDEALSTFRKGLDNGHWWAESQFLDTDLDPLRDISTFKKLVEESKQRWEIERKQIKQDRIFLVPDETDADTYPLLVSIHGRNGNKEYKLEYWKFLRQKGWAVLSPQSTQPLFPNSFCWDDPERGVQDIHFHVNDVLSSYPIDRQRVLIGGFSQGSGMAIYTALSGKIPVRGFIACATWWPDVDTLAALSLNVEGVRGYFVVGEKDYTLERTREIQSVLKKRGIPFAEEVHPDLEHEFPNDFEKSLNLALEFILEE